MTTNADRKMLKNIRHISEGNFYGLRVTNKARRVSLNKELRTLEACKEAQVHIYRKEERELLNTLQRLKKSKDVHHLIEEHLGRQKNDSDHYLHHEGEVHKEHSTPAQSGNYTKPHAEISDISLVVQLSPVASSTILALSPRRPPPRMVLPPREGGSEIHRTTAFIDCVICKLPRYLQTGGQGNVCTCEKGPQKGTHIVHSTAEHSKGHPQHSKGNGDSHTHRKTKGEDNLHKSARHGRNRIRSLETEDNTSQAFLAKLHREMTRVVDHPLHVPQELSSDRNGTRNIVEDRGYYPPGARHRRESFDDERYRMRGDSIDEIGTYTVGQHPRKGSLDEQDFIGWNRRRGMSNVSRDREDSIGGESFYSVGEFRCRTASLEDPQLFKRTFRTHNSVHQQETHNEHRDHTYPTHETASHLPHLTHEDTAFHGLIHPDNIYNHHHYLPYEAEKPVKRRRHLGDHHYGNGRYHDDQPHLDEHHQHGNVHNPHHSGYYIHKYDHLGQRQVAYAPSGSSSHIAAAIEKQHEPDSTHLALLSKLRQLLNVYQQLDDTSPKYPWPRPPTVNMTQEEFHKLKNCRYLRLPKSMEDARFDTATHTPR